MFDAALEIVGRQTFGGAFADRDAAIAAYRGRTEEVRATIAPERLLVFDVAAEFQLAGLPATFPAGAQHRAVSDHD
jgi:hypothetical protein